MRSPKVRILIITIGFILGLLPFGIVNQVIGQEEGQELQSSIDYAFGQEVRFSLRISNGTDVERITLFVRPKLEENYFLIDVPFEPSDTISVTYSLNAKDFKLKPFRQVNFYWDVRAETESFRTAEETINYEDDRFVWQQMTQEAATVHWTGSGPFFGQEVLNVADDALKELAFYLPINKINPYDIYVYPSSADLRAALRLAGVSGNSSSQPELGVILVTAVNPQSATVDLGQSIPFDLAQLLIYSVSGENYNNIPWWLREGIGITVQSQLNPRFEQLLNEAINEGKTIPLTELCLETERRGDRVLLASAQSHSIVNFILNRYGEQSISNLISTYIEGDSCEVGIKRVVGISIEELENNWLESLKAQSPLMIFFNHFGLWLILLCGGTAIMVLIVYSTRFKSS